MASDVLLGQPRGKCFEKKIGLMAVVTAAPTGVAKTGATAFEPDGVGIWSYQLSNPVPEQFHCGLSPQRRVAERSFGSPAAILATPGVR